MFFLATPTTAQDMNFIDIRTTDRFYDAVKYVFERELQNSAVEAIFVPNANLTHAMLVTIFYRYEAAPVVTGAASFADVANSQWYSEAIAWVNANYIVGGYGDGSFGTNDNIAREQFAAILYRHAQFKKLNTVKTTDLVGYTDAAIISAWATDAMKWASADGLINGCTETTLTPSGTTTRAEAATILMRFIEGFVK